jgi:ATP-binding protein involved in chromosome partitioning
VAVKPAWNLTILVGKFLDRLAAAPREAFDPFEVRRETPEAWVLKTGKP